MVLASRLFATMGVGVKIAASSFNITALLLRAHGTPIRTSVP